MTMTLLAALGALALTVQAQDAGGPPAGGPPGGDEQGGGPGQGRHHPPMPALLRALDANHDGIIDSNEIANASSVLKSLDKNGDGQLTRDEYMGARPGGDGGNADSKNSDGPQGAPPGSEQNGSPGGPGGQGGGPGGPGGGRRHPPMPALIRALDANHDSVIDSNEIANASAVLKTLDKNADGQLTRDEYMGPRPNRPPQDSASHGGGNEAGGPPDGPPPGN